MLEFKIIIIFILLLIILFGFIFYKIFIQNNLFFKLFLNSRKNNKAKQKKIYKQQQKNNEEYMLIKQLIYSLGGNQNIQNVKENSIRLRVILKNEQMINKRDLRKNKIVSGVITKNNIYQLIINGNEDLVKKIKKTMEIKR